MMSLNFQRGVRRLDTVESEEQTQENLSDAISRTLEFLNKKQKDESKSEGIETKPDEHDKTTSTSITANQNVTQQTTTQDQNNKK